MKVPRAKNRNNEANRNRHQDLIGKKRKKASLAFRIKIHHLLILINLLVRFSLFPFIKKNQ